MAELVQVNLAGPGAVGPGLLSEDHLPLAVDQAQDGVAESVVGSQLVGFPELPYPLLLSHHHTQLTQETILQFWNNNTRKFYHITYVIHSLVYCLLVCLILGLTCSKQPHSVALARDPECFRVNQASNLPLTYILTVAALHRLSRSPLALRTQTGYQSYCCEFGVLSGWFAIQGGLLVVGALQNPVWSQLQPSSSGNTQCSPDLLWSFVLQIFNV